MGQWGAGRQGIRRQSVIVAVGVVAAALGAGTGLLLWLLHVTLSKTLLTSANGQLADAAAVVAAEGPAGVEAAERAEHPAGEGVLQVVGPDGVLVYSTRRATRPLSDLRPAPGAVAVRGDDTAVLPSERPLEVARGVAHGGRAYVVLVVASQAEQRSAIITTGTILLLGTPVLLALTGAMTWWLTGRALRPVERIRAEVRRIEFEDLARRVAVPDSQDEIAALAETMNDMLARLEAAQRGQRRFVSDASHELRSPLATLGASLELGRDDPSGRSWEGLGDLMADEVSRMGRLVDDLLTLAKADDRGLRVEAEDVDLDELVEREARRLRAQGRHRVEVRAAHVRVTGDPVRLTQVLRNLCENAERAARSRLRLVLSRDGGEAVVRIEDDGDGIPAGERRRIFERFVRLDDSRTRASGGSGLGLAIVAEIVAVHGGSVTAGVAPELGGAAMEVRLPAQPLDLQDEAAEPGAG